MQADTKKRDRVNRLRSLFVVPQSSLLVGDCVTEPNGSIRFWSLEDGRLTHVIDLGMGEWSHAVAISHDGNSIAVTLLTSGEVGCYSIKDRKWKWRVKWMEKNVVDSKIKFASDDQTIIVLGSQNTVTYDANTGNIIKKAEDMSRFSGGHSLYSVPLTVLSQSGRYAAVWQGRLEHNEWSFKSAFQSKWAVVWNLEKNKIIADMKRVATRYKNCGGTFDPGEKYLTLGSMDGHIRVWAIDDGQLVKDWKAYWGDKALPFDSDAAPYAISSMTFSSDGHLLATLGKEKIPSTANIKLWDFSTSSLLHEFEDVTRTTGLCDVYPMTFSADGETFAFEKEGQLCLYEASTWKEKWCVNTLPDVEPIKKEIK